MAATNMSEQRSETLAADLGVLDFERPVVELENKLKELRSVNSDSDVNIADEVERLEENARELAQKIFSNLNDWQISQLARHQLRPHTRDYVAQIFTDVHILHGDRMFAEDPAIVTGLARIDGQPVAFIGHEKGRTTKEKVARNFGMPRPEGYRKALRVMKLAERMQLPVVTFIDTPGAYPGIDAEERGQSEAIARNLMEMSALSVPVMVVVIGEGGSGGALAIGVGDHVAMLEHAIYSVISPEGCASILYKNSDRAADAAAAMGITAERLKSLGLIDHIVPEPLGGAHRDLATSATALKAHIRHTLSALMEQDQEARLAARHARLSAFGRFSGDV